MQRTIAILVDRSPVSYAVARGIGSYIKRHDLPWVQVSISPKQIDVFKHAQLDRLELPYDGIIGFISNKSVHAWAAAKHCPVVHYNGCEFDDPHLYISGDDTAIGTMAARHLIGQGYRSFACVGRYGIDTIARRFDAFSAELARHGHGCAINDHGKESVSNQHPDGPEAGLAAWLRSLPQPVGLFFHQDRAALYTIGICAAHGIRIPEEVAILGVDNISDACEASQPPLSSIALPWTHMGALGALHLHRMIESPADTKAGTFETSIEVPPLRVVARASTAPPHITDALAARCMDELTAHYHKRISIAEIAAQLGVNPSTLHRHLVTATGRNAEDHLHRLRIERACELLATTTLPIGAIATSVGYANRQRFGSMFRQRTGMTARSFRNQC